MAQDLRSAISAVAKLPVDEQQLIATLQDYYQDAALNREDEDHTTFWLVLADQSRRRGIKATVAFERAFSIIDAGLDLEMMRTLGMDESALKARGKKLLGLTPPS